VRYALIDATVGIYFISIVRDRKLSRLVAEVVLTFGRLKGSATSDSPRIQMICACPRIKRARIVFTVNSFAGLIEDVLLAYECDALKDRSRTIYILLHCHALNFYIRYHTALCRHCSVASEASSIASNTFSNSISSPIS
jgi:hypothetical protein